MLQYNDDGWGRGFLSARPLFLMKRATLAALFGCAIAGVAIGATPPQKAATPATKTAPSTAHATVQKKGTASPASRPATTGQTPAKSPPKSTANRTTTPAASASAKTPATRTASRKYYSRQPVVRRSYSAQQISPTADRYREIQDALAAKGYLKTPPSGVWDKDSIDAMTRFQQDQKLDPTGKLTARSLGALGLGPKPADAAAPSASRADGTSPNPSGEATPLQ
jgi:hypothetical protein